MQLYFVLKSPARAENVGAAARAMKTMGFSQMRLVNSRVHEEDKAHWVAHGAQEILDQAEYFAELAPALADMDLVIATTARERGRYRYYLTPQQAIAQVNNKQVQKVALLFGCEESGLSNEDLALADIISYLPLKVSYPSLNLGQAIMLYAYEFSQGVQEPVAENSGADAEAHTENKQLRLLQQKTAQLFDDIGVEQQEKLAEWVFDRLPMLEQRDLNLLHLLYKDLDRALSERRGG
ncbi:tRNA/rRNA methyltransferase [Oceanisphaera profunda]|uniref:tRNA (cytidine/uridine-2'-O-)-methyltransferase TrmJ n=1 Tax=Oceanisphaera profunda TaxID=1416627 RepID=A0A1Y0D9R6_9GAMM|nr:tRNA/rRNA methyltransferase [Oceanisphaera profunda]ART83926.1 tRNA/rRNA methyltransferase [Oceanisphaera profunda]